MTAGIIQLDDRTVLVEPPRIGVGLVLEAAAALIEECGWRQGGRTEAAGGSVLDSGKAGGFSLHDAIGGACELVSGAEDATGQLGKSSKDFTYTTAQGVSASLRTEASEAVQKHLPADQNDIAFNDAASDVSEVLAVLRAAREEATT